MNAQAPSAQAHWTRQHERSQRWVLVLMRWIALVAGRRIARWVLHPIALYFFVTGSVARRESRRYLALVLPHPVRWRDVYRHIHTFASTVLDRVYLLQGRIDLFDVSTSGVESVDAVLTSGRGALLVGAHFGSFEALRALGDRQGRRVAMLMYEDNARLINATLAAVAPHANLHTIALGRTDAMLELRRWLDEGGVAGLLADRTLPAAASGRSRIHVLPFLGRPARFSDGPFRLAALLRSPVVFMTGLYHGANRYEIRFEHLADFSAAGESSAARDERIAAALQAFVATLETLCRESPYNWFNFFDFWADESTSNVR